MYRICVFIASRTLTTAFVAAYVKLELVTSDAVVRITLIVVYDRSVRRAEIDVETDVLKLRQVKIGML